MARCASAGGPRLGVFHAELHFHDPANLEFNCSLFRHFDALERLRILCRSGGTNTALKYAEVSKFQAVTLAKFLDDVIQEALNNAFDNDSLVARAVGVSIVRSFLVIVFMTCTLNPVEELKYRGCQFIWKQV